jgi:hypothetical protein
VSAALDLLQQFEAIGAKVENRAGRLVLRPSERPIPAAMIAAARLAKGELLAAVASGQAREPATGEPVEHTAANGNEPEPVLLADGRRLWRFRAESIPEIMNDADIRPAVEARWCGCVLVADGHELIVVEPWLSHLPDHTRAELAANAGTIIALLRGESRRRTGR